MSYLRWALFTVPTIVFLGFLSGKVANSGYENRWFAALEKPSFMPPGWAFPVAWTTLYILLGLAVAIILHARGARMRGTAITLFVVQMAMNLVWSPLFFRAHMVEEAFFLIVAMIVVSLVIIWLFSRIRVTAGLLMVPYVAWLIFAAMLNFSIDRLNPDASTLVVPAAKPQIMTKF